MHKTADVTAQQIIEKQKKLLKTINDAIVEFEKMELPEKLTSFESTSVALKMKLGKLLEASSSPRLNSTEKLELNSLVLQEVMILIGLDKKVLEGLDQLKDKELLDYLRSRPPLEIESIHKQGLEHWRSLPDDEILKLVHEIIPKRKMQLREDINFLGKFVELTADGQELESYRNETPMRDRLRKFHKVEFD